MFNTTSYRIKEFRYRYIYYYNILLSGGGYLRVYTLFKSNALKWANIKVRLGPLVGWQGRGAGDGGGCVTRCSPDYTLAVESQAGEWWTERGDDVRLQFPPNTCTKANGINRVPGCFFPYFSGSRIYTTCCSVYWNTGKQYAGLFLRFFFLYFFSVFSSPVRLKIYSSITFRVSALSGRKRVVHGRA